MQSFVKAEGRETKAPLNFQEVECKVYPGGWMHHTLTLLQEYLQGKDARDYQHTWVVLAFALSDIVDCKDNKIEEYLLRPGATSVTGEFNHVIKFGFYSNCIVVLFV